MATTLPIMAPHYLPQTTIILPLPNLADERTSMNQVDVKEFMNGDLGTYVRRVDRMKFSFNFEITAAKCEEFRRFFRAYSAEAWRMYHWSGTVWVVTPIVPEFVPVTIGPGEYKDLSIELEGYKLT